MHNIRVKGNIASHEPEDINVVSARKVFAELLSLFCWHFQIDDTDLSEDEEPATDPSKMKFRFFVADGIHKPGRRSPFSPKMVCSTANISLG